MIITLSPKKHQVSLALLVLLFFCTSCNKMVFPIATPAKASWKAYVEYDETIPAATQQTVNKEFDRFLANANMSIVKFNKAADTTEADMVIRIKDFEHVSKGKQVTGAIVTFLGVTVPPLALTAAGAPFYFVFWYTPKTHSTATMYVRDGESNSHVRRKTYGMLGPGFLRKKPKQETIHSKAYRKYFKRVLKYYQHEILAAKRKGLPTTP